MIRKSPSKAMVSNSSKSKKKEKKKVFQIGEPSSSSSSCSSIEKMQINVPSENEKKYSGFGPDTIQCVSEQFLGEKVSEDICTTLAEDLSFKIREILQASCINMRQSKRKHLKVDDINSTLKKYNIEQIYGPSNPNWLTITDKINYSFIPDYEIDIYDLASSEYKTTEPGDIGVNFQWLSDTALFNQLLVTNSLTNYSQKIMNAAVSQKKPLRMLALRDVAKNVNIGPIIPHLCNFCFLILQKNITYSSLAAPTLQFLEAVMFNPCTSFSAEENQMTLLIYLLLENIMNATNVMLYDVVPICRTLGRLCINFPRGTQIVVEKINKYLIPEEPVLRLSAPVICALNYIGIETLNILLWPNIAAMFKCINKMAPIDKLYLNAAILTSANLMYQQYDVWNTFAEKMLSLEFEDQLQPFWRCNCLKKISDNENTYSVQQNWINIKKSLLKTLKIHSQQDVSNRQSCYKTAFRKARPVNKINQLININVAGCKNLTVKQKKLSKMDLFSAENIVRENVNVVTGRRTLFTLKKNFCDVNNAICNKNIPHMLYMM